MEPEVVGGSAGHCGLVRCVEADDPKTPISVVDGPATGGVRGAVSRDLWHGLAVPLPPLRRISSATGLRRLWVDLLVPGIVVELIQHPRLNCCAGRSSSALASWLASLAPLF